LEQDPTHDPPASGSESTESAPTARAHPARDTREVRKTVTVLFADVAGSTALGERVDPESMRRVMGRYFDEMRAILERHGGTVEKFIGDAVMAVFGIPLVHDDDPLRAVRAAVEMREGLATLNAELEAQWGVRLDVRMGLNTGEVVAGGLDASTYATGDAINIASRLQNAARPGEILIGLTTHRFARDAVLTEGIEPLTLKGKADPVAAFSPARLGIWRGWPSRPSRVTHGWPPTREPAPARRLRAGNCRPLLPAVHGARSRGRRQVPTHARVPRRRGRNRSRRQRTLPALWGRDHLLAIARSTAFWRMGVRRTSFLPAEYRPNVRFLLGPSEPAETGVP
jgi:class 3 adenylate cyclase